MCRLVKVLLMNLKIKAAQCLTNIELLSSWRLGPVIQTVPEKLWKLSEELVGQKFGI